MTNPTYTRDAETGVITLKIDDETFTSEPSDFDCEGLCAFKGDARCRRVKCCTDDVPGSVDPDKGIWIIWVRKS